MFKKIYYMCKELEKIIYLMFIMRKYFLDNSEC